MHGKPKYIGRYNGDTDRPKDRYTDTETHTEIPKYKHIDTGNRK